MDDFKRLVPMMVIALAGMAMLVYGPIPQAPHYHSFADTRALLGVANGGDVLSNLGFAIVGTWGALALLPHGEVPGTFSRESASLWLFVAALVMTAFGSGYYHLAPDNTRLVWDRLPIAIACGALLAAAYIRTHDTSLTLTLPIGLALFGVGTVFWWSITEARGVGDLRPYIMLQGAPLVLIPLWQWIARSPRRDRLLFGAAVLLYVLAKVAELNDRAIFDTLGFASGHTFKHLLAAIAAAFILASFVTPGTDHLAHRDGAAPE